MPSVDFHRSRRDALRQLTKTPILLMGNKERPRNIPMNHLPFRQDSSFLYFTGCNLPNAALLLTQDKEILFLPSPPQSDALWHGPTPSIQKQAQKLGFEHVAERNRLEDHIKPLSTTIQTIAVPDLSVNLDLESWFQRKFRFGTSDSGSAELINAICTLRRILQDEEIDILRQTMLTTRKAHIAAMKSTKPNVHEQDVAAAFSYELAKDGCSTAYHSIVTVDGHILHNHHYRNTLKSGQLLLLDGGAESASGYATDITRTWPVSGSFTPRQTRAYNAVLKAQEMSISMITKGTRYRDVHFKACEHLASFLCDEKLLLCSEQEALETGAHALFFPHGVGHLLGLDVHDLENFGDIAAYAAGRTRPEGFGSAYLRLDLDLCPGMVVTIEPGFYIVPEIFKATDLIERHNQRINWPILNKWIGFGGIRIEDNILCTDKEPEILSSIIPKSIDDIETLMEGP